MEFLGKPLRMFQIDCPFDRLEDPFIKAILTGIFELRKEGYLSYHNYGILPVDTYDFIGTHFGIYYESDDGIKVVTSYRAVEYGRCQQFKLPFPLEVILKNSNADTHSSALNRFIEQATAQRLPLYYSGSWTIAPSMRTYPEIYQKIYDMFFAMNILSTLEEPNQVRLACGSVRLKTVRPIQWMGYRYFQSETGADLPHFQQSNLNNEDVMAMVFKEPSEEAIEAAKLFQFQFRNRTRIERPEQFDQKVKKAS